jgi:hypothetical protein
VVRAIDPVHGIEVGGKKALAPQKRSHRFLESSGRIPMAARIAHDG